MASTKKTYTYSVNKPTYQKSKSQLETESALKNKENSKPEAYVSKYGKELSSVLNSILNRDEFKYTLNADPLYKQYREQYIRNGERAMADTVGRVSALTGGYGSSYAVTAGSKSYNNELAKLNSVALDLYDRAYNVYKDKGDSLYSSLDALRNLDSDDYKKYRDTVSDYYNDRDYLYKKLGDMSDFEYEQFLDELEAWEDERDFSYKKYQDELKVEQNERDAAFKKAEAERAQANADRDYALALKKLYLSGSSSGSGSSSKSSKTSGDEVEYPETYDDFVKSTGRSYILTETEFKMRKSSVEKYGTYTNYLKKMYKKYA